jgi:hypothetical protein
MWACSSKAAPRSAAPPAQVPAQAQAQVQVQVQAQVQAEVQAQAQAQARRDSVPEPVRLAMVLAPAQPARRCRRALRRPAPCRLRQAKRYRRRRTR